MAAPPDGIETMPHQQRSIHESQHTPHSRHSRGSELRTALTTPSRPSISRGAPGAEVDPATWTSRCSRKTPLANCKAGRHDSTARHYARGDAPLRGRASHRGSRGHRRCCGGRRCPRWRWRNCRSLLPHAAAARMTGLCGPLRTGPDGARVAMTDVAAGTLTPAEHGVRSAGGASLARVGHRACRTVLPAAIGSSRERAAGGDFGGRAGDSGCRRRLAAASGARQQGLRSCERARPCPLR